MSAPAPARFEEAVTAMTLPENRFDVTIICTTDDHQADFWMSKLKKKKITSISGAADSSSLFPLVVAVSEDWTSSGGAGNGLGTLYAWKKACEYAKQNCAGNPDLENLLKDGSISAALYHTAGKGTRMAPLPASENNNKPGVVRRFYTFYIRSFVHYFSFLLSLLLLFGTAVVFSFLFSQPFQFFLHS